MSALRANGFRVGTGQQLRLQHLMEQLSQDIEPQALKTRLAPIFVKNREEQQLFYELFDLRKIGHCFKNKEGNLFFFIPCQTIRNLDKVLMFCIKLTTCFALWIIAALVLSLLDFSVISFLLQNFGTQF